MTCERLAARLCLCLAARHSAAYNLAAKSGHPPTFWPTNSQGACPTAYLMPVPFRGVVDPWTLGLLQHILSQECPNIQGVSVTAAG